MSVLPVDLDPGAIVALFRDGEPVVVGTARSGDWEWSLAFHREYSPGHVWEVRPY